MTESIQIFLGIAFLDLERLKLRDLIDSLFLFRVSGWVSREHKISVTW